MNRLKLIICSIFMMLIFNVIVFASPYVNLQLTYDGKVHNYNNEKVYLNVNYKQIEGLPLEPIILNDYTLVPAREVLENVGANVYWLKDTNQIQVIYKDKVMTMQIGNKMASINGKYMTMELEPKLINGKTMVPVRFVSEAIGLIVEWDSKTRTIYVIEPTIKVEQMATETATENTSEDVINTTSKELTETTTEIQNKDKIDIYDIKMPNSDERTFKILSDKKIEKFKRVQLENGMIAVDIYNSINKITETSKKSVMQSVSEVLIDGLDNGITRFIFKTNEDIKDMIFLSEDKQTLNVNFGGNLISKIQTDTDKKNNVDIIKIYSELKPDIKINNLGDKIVINIKGADILSLTEDFDANKFISNIKYTKEEKGYITIILEVKEKVKEILSYEDETVVITLTNDLREENTVISDVKFTIPKGRLNININKTKYINDYLNQKYILEFNQDISKVLDSKNYSINNQYIDKMNIEGNKIEFDTKKITAITITEDNENIYINFMNPKDKYNTVIVIDPGHGGAASGTVGNQLIEKDINLDIALRLEKLLANEKDIKAYLTRLTDVNPSFDFRTEMGDEVADMFISIHNNSAENKNSKPNGTEVFYLNPNTSDTGLTSKILAQIMQENLLNELNSLDRKIKTSNLIVLRNSKNPAVLCEIGFLSNQEEAKKLATSSYRQKAAMAIYNGILEVTKTYPSKR